ncbi:hypothetical protein BCV70DRAFT_198587 [Testicularia cyperi]|uniref:Uncharacterized protein n=1 Tax=Testicularia cyperi TaxID=1882483 RepID=A0A317XVH8_9BASI|nr:hypothetical protein BCV70DRAFT_198587 [Testicularia cyperi]
MTIDVVLCLVDRAAAVFQDCAKVDRIRRPSPPVRLVARQQEATRVPVHADFKGECQGKIRYCKKGQPSVELAQTTVPTSNLHGISILDVLVLALELDISGVIAMICWSQKRKGCRPRWSSNLRNSPSKGQDQLESVDETLVCGLSGNPSASPKSTVESRNTVCSTLTVDPLASNGTFGDITLELTGAIQTELVQKGIAVVSLVVLTETVGCVGGTGRTQPRQHAAREGKGANKGREGCLHGFPPRG